MTKAKISQYDAIAANNTDVNGVNIAEGCPPSGMNNMGREIMAALKRFQTGADGDSVTVGGSLVVSGSVTAANTATLGNVDINAGTIDGTAIGGSTPAAGSFTTLNTSGAVVFNDAGADVDFRVEGDTDANLLFVDASADAVGIGDASLETKLQISGVSTSTSASGAGALSANRIYSGGVIELIRNTSATTGSFSGVQIGSTAGNGNLQSLGLLNVSTASGFAPNFVITQRTDSDTMTERMRIDPSGRLLVGTTSSSSVGGAEGLLQLETTGSSAYASIKRNSNDGSGPVLALAKSRGTSNGSHTIVQDDDNLGVINFIGADGGDSETAAARIACQVDGTPGANDMPGRLVFSTTADGSASPTERMRIDTSGNVIIASPAATDGYIRLGIDANGGATFLPHAVSGAGNTPSQLNFYGNSTATLTCVAFRYGNGIAATAVGTITRSTTATAYNTSSDYRLKENVAPMTGALEKVLELNPVTYTWKVDGSAGEGFIAHELQEVCPQAVTGEKDATEIQQVEVSPEIEATYDEEGNELTPAVEAVYEEREVPVYQGVDSSFLVATLTAAIQELKAELDAAKERIAALENA